jgi:Lon protease-like protein
MNNCMNSAAAGLADFNGRARLFPLPNLVLFPHVVQPLHIFEPRYRQMVSHALAGDGLIAMALLQPGWEEDYEGRPGVHPVACLGKIVAHEQMEDGRFNIILRGLARLRIEQELSDTNLYRTAQATVLDEILASPPEEEALRKRLIAVAAEWLIDRPSVVSKIANELGKQLPLSALCDVLAFALPLAAESKQALLAQVDVQRRVQLLMETMTPSKPTEKKDRLFPPPFSDN